MNTSIGGIQTDVWYSSSERGSGVHAGIDVWAFGAAGVHVGMHTHLYAVSISVAGRSPRCEVECTGRRKSTLSTNCSWNGWYEGMIGLSGITDVFLRESVPCL